MRGVRCASNESIKGCGAAFGVTVHARNGQYVKHTGTLRRVLLCSVQLWTQTIRKDE